MKQHKDGDQYKTVCGGGRCVYDSATSETLPWKVFVGGTCVKRLGAVVSVDMYFRRMYCTSLKID